jgi:hypothetical protein
MIVDDLDVIRASIYPSETNTRLVIYPNGVLPFSVTFKGLKPISRWRSQVFDILGTIDKTKLCKAALGNIGSPLSAAPSGPQTLGIAIGKASDHPYL